MSRFLLLVLLILIHTLKADKIRNVPRYAFAVFSGYSVTWSSLCRDFDCTIPRLNANNYFWGAVQVQQGEWVQVSSPNPVKWVGVVTQGRGNAPQWVTAFTVSYTLDGTSWAYVDNMRQFQGNSDSNTLVRNTFYWPIFAKTIRINPTAWYSWISLRFDAIYELEI